MADPVIAGAYRAQLVLQGKSGLPEDRFVTTWAFTNVIGADVQADSDLISNALETFVTVAPPGGSVAAGGYLSGIAINQAAGAQVRVYHLGDPIPREPIIEQFALPAMSTTAVMPNEVALTLSFYADRNLPRQRGRVFWGPLATSAGTLDAVRGDFVPGAGTMTNLGLSLKRLSEDTNLDWCVLSQTDGVLRPVTNGWVDSSFDTQRRRGVKPSSRTTWAHATLG